MIRQALYRGAKALTKATPTRGALERVARYCKADHSLVSRWRAGKCKPLTRYRILLQKHLGIALPAWELRK